MDTTADNLVSQVTNVLLDKLTGQDSGIGFLKKFLGEITKKYSLPDSLPIKQKIDNPTSTEQKNNNISQNVIKDFKKMYRDVLNDSGYVNDYKRFLKKVFTGDNLGVENKKKPFKLIAEEQEPVYIIIDGLSDKGAKDFKDKLFNDLLKDINLSFDKSIKGLIAGQKQKEKGLIEEMIETFSDIVPDSVILPGGGGGGKRKKSTPPKKPARPRARRPGRLPVPLPLPGGGPKPAPLPKGVPPLPAPKPAPLPKGAPPLPAPKPAPLPKGAPPLPAPKSAPLPKGGGGIGGIIGKLFLPVITAYEAVTNIGESISELKDKETLSTGQKVATGGAALTGGAADILTAFDPTTWGIDKMLGYDVFGEGLTPELLNLIGAKKEDQTMGDSLRERTTDLFEALNYELEENLKLTEKTNNKEFDLVDLLPHLGKAGYLMPGVPGPIAEQYISSLIQTPQYEKQLSEKEPKLATGGIVTEPTRALVGEAGPEAVIPLEKFFNNVDMSLNNTTLEDIASNTKNTNQALGALADAIVRMVTVFNQKTNIQKGTTIINSGSSRDSTSASVAANFNSDPIRRVRAQFMS